MKAKDIVIDAQATLGKTPILTEIRPIFEYKDGRKISDSPSGFRYVVASEHNLEKVGVKIEGNQQLDMPSGLSKVCFEDLELGLYVDNANQIQISAKASKIAFADTGRQAKA